MRYINGGVTLTYVEPGIHAHGITIPTKKALREAVKTDPSSVTFYPTAAEWFPDARWEGLVSEVPDGVSLSVCGPDPYRNRRWYAQVCRRNGRVIVS